MRNPSQQRRHTRCDDTAGQHILANQPQLLSRAKPGMDFFGAQAEFRRIIIGAAKRPFAFLLSAASLQHAQVAQHPAQRSVEVLDGVEIRARLCELNESVVDQVFRRRLFLSLPKTSSRLEILVVRGIISHYVLQRFEAPPDPAGSRSARSRTAVHALRFSDDLCGERQTIHCFVPGGSSFSGAGLTLIYTA
jgi:hypothetical protein